MSCRDSRITLLICSIMCTGTRMVRAWSEMERVMACRIHQVAYVENLYPLRYSNFSTALMSPMLPSCTRSKKCRPRLVYFFAMLTTRRRLALMRRSLASFIVVRPRSISSAMARMSSILFSKTVW